MLTTSEVAGILGITTGAVRMMAQREELHPHEPGARPLRFHEDEVWTALTRRTQPVEPSEARAAWQQICEAIPA